MVAAVRAGAMAKDELETATLEKLHAVLGDDAELAALMQEMASLFRPVFRLSSPIWEAFDKAWVSPGRVVLTS